MGLNDDLVTNSAVGIEAHGCTCCTRALVGRQPHHSCLSSTRMLDSSVAQLASFHFGGRLVSEGEGGRCGGDRRRRFTTALGEAEPTWLHRCGSTAAETNPSTQVNAAMAAQGRWIVAVASSGVSTASSSSASPSSSSWVFTLVRALAPRRGGGRRSKSSSSSKCCIYRGASRV